MLADRGAQLLAHRQHVDPHGPQRAASSAPGRGISPAADSRCAQRGRSPVQAVSALQRGRRPGLPGEQAEEHMLVPDVPVAELLGFGPASLITSRA